MMSTVATATRTRPAKPDSTLSVLHALLAQGATLPTYEDLAEVTGLSPRTVASAMSRLRENDLVRRGSAQLGAAWGYTLAIALGSESCRAGLVDANAALVCEYAAEPLRDQKKLAPGLLLKRIKDVAEVVLERAREKPELLVGGRLPLIGVVTAWPSPVRGSKRAAGTIMHRDWMTYKPATLPAAVAEKLGCPAKRSHALNDANAHALAVAFDRARARAKEPDDSADRIALVLRIGGGLGASTMILAPHQRARLCFIESTMLGGARSLAGELAHLPINYSVVGELNDRSRWVDGLAPLSMSWLCSCGQTGHLGALASGAAWKRRMDESEIRIPPQLEAMRRGELDRTDEALSEINDPRIAYSLEDIGRLIGRSLAGSILLLDPHSLTLTGSFAVKPVLHGIMSERETWRHVFGDALDISLYGSPEANKYVGVRGAALAVIRSHIYRRFAEHLQTPPQASGLTFSL